MHSNGSVSDILERPVFGRLLFAQCWEDPRMDFEALEVGPGKTLLSVTSGGCNTLSLATLEPDRIIAVDLNPVQNWMLELKVAGVRALGHGEYLELLGVRGSDRRWDLYHSVRDELTDPACRYWDTQRPAIEGGVLRAGRYERYLGAFRVFLRAIHGRKTIERLFANTSVETQRRFYDYTWDTLPWRLFFRIFFSRTVLGIGGLDAAFFTYVHGISSFGEHFRARARHALVNLPVRDNYFVAQICLGQYLDEEAVPPYLRAEHFPALKRTVERIEIVTGELGEVLRDQPDDSIDAFNYSNIFEWVPAETFETVLRETHRVARPAARLCYRNLLVQRRHLPSLDHLFDPHHELAARLLETDRSFAYSNFEVASVRKNGRNGS